MFSMETTLMGVALAIDAAVASFAVGILNLDLSVHHKFRRGFLICLLFGFFQSLMVWLGSFAGFYLSFSSYGHLFQLVVALIFLVIGVKVIQESLDDDDEPIIWGFMSLILMAVATSIDAMAAGVSLGTLPNTHITAFEIGVITFIICAVSYSCSFFLKSLPTNWLLRVAAVIFFFLGGQIIVQYYI